MLNGAAAEFEQEFTNGGKPGQGTSPILTSELGTQELRKWNLSRKTDAIRRVISGDEARSRSGTSSKREGEP
jgi:hypothetical protein